MCHQSFVVMKPPVTLAALKRSDVHVHKVKVVGQVLQGRVRLAARSTRVQLLLLARRIGCRIG